MIFLGILKWIWAEAVRLAVWGWDLVLIPLQCCPLVPSAVWSWDFVLVPLQGWLSIGSFVIKLSDGRFIGRLGRLLHCKDRGELDGKCVFSVVKMYDLWDGRGSFAFHPDGCFR